MTNIAIERAPDGVVLTVLVVAGASRSDVVGPHGNALRIRVAAPPEKGRANAEAERLLTQFFEAPVRLVAGHTSRHKRFLLVGLDAAETQRRLQTIG